MAQKFEILKDDFLKVTDTVTSQIKLLEPKSNVFYSASELNTGAIKIYGIQGINRSSSVIFNSEIGEAVDASDVVFTAQTFEDFCTDSKLGFKAASGGSGAGGDSYIQMYSQTWYRLPSDGNFVGVDDGLSFEYLRFDVNSGESVPVNYLAKPTALIIGYSDFAYKLEKIRVAGNIMQNGQEVQLVVGYRDIRQGTLSTADSANPVVLHTELIDYGGSTINTWGKLVTFETPLDIPAGKEIVIGYKCTIFDGTPAIVDIHFLGTTLTLKKV